MHTFLSILLWTLLFSLLVLIYFLYRSYKAIDFYYETIGRNSDFGNAVTIIDNEIRTIFIDANNQETIDQRIKQIEQKQIFLQKRIDEIRLVRSKFTLENFIWSLKPLKLEAWLSEEEIKQITTPLLP